MIWVNTIVFHITQLPQKADNCCYSATVECRVHLRFLYAHAESYHRYSRERTPFFARSFPFIFWALWHRRLRAHADSFVVKKKERKEEEKEKGKKIKRPLAVYNSLRMKALTSCPYFLPWDAVWKSAFLADCCTLSRCYCRNVTSTVQLSTIFN